VRDVKISGYFKTGPLEGAYIVAHLLATKFGIDDDLEFIVDTGASKTIISDRDALWLGIDYGKLRKAKPSLGIGGTVRTFAIDGAELIFRKDSGGSSAIGLESVFVMKHRKADEGIMRIPSILGRDFLNRYSLVCSHKTGTAKITDEKIST